MNGSTNNWYAITVENPATGDREEWLWNQAAANPEEALRRSDLHLRQLGWPKEWKSTEARELGPVPADL